MCLKSNTFDDTYKLEYYLVLLEVLQGSTRRLLLHSLHFSILYYTTHCEHILFADDLKLFKNS